MYKKRITLAEIKQEAKDLKQSNPSLRHTQALNKIAQKYGYEKFEVLKAKVENKNDEQFILIHHDTNDLYLADEGNSYLPNLYNQDYKIPQFKYLKNKKVAIIGNTATGKTSMILALHEHLDKSTTLFIDSQKASVLNGSVSKKDKEHFIKYFNREYPIFRNASFIDFNSNDIDIKKFKTIVIDEGWQVPTSGMLFNAIKKVLLDLNKTVIITFQTVQDAKRMGVDLTPLQELNGFDKEKSSLSFYTINPLLDTAQKIHKFEPNGMVVSLQELLKDAIKGADVIITDGKEPEEIKQELIRYSKKTKPGSGMSFANMKKQVILDEAYKILSNKTDVPVPNYRDLEFKTVKKTKY